jgi:glycosyltransferase involved in cell wall biosynthesis
MRIGIDAHMVGEKETGNETYVTNLLRGLGLLGMWPDCVALATDRELLAQRLGSDGQLASVTVSRSPLVRILRGIPSAVRRWNIDVLHSSYIAPPALSCPAVVSIHDIAYEHFPSFFSLRDRLVLSTLVPRSARCASRVLTLSESSRRDLVECYGISPDKIVAIPLAPAPEFRPVLDDSQMEEIRQRYGTSTRYILAVGNLQPRKNISRLVEAYASLRVESDSLPRLVIVGRAQWRASEVYRTVERSGLQEQVRFTGYVPDEDLVPLYSGSEVLVYPSIYEGFGLPILEAMACGTPVITSRTSSMPEVAGDAALLVDPYSTAEIAETISLVLTNENLKQDLAKRGLKRAAQFTWEQTAQETLSVYRQVANRSGQA